MSDVPHPIIGRKGSLATAKGTPNAALNLAPNSTSNPEDTLNRSGLIDKLTLEFTQLEPRDVDFCVREIFKVMGDALAGGKRIELRGFGSFSINRRAPRMARNPRSGEMVPVGEKYHTHFKPGKQLKERVMAG